jgi:predicted ATPase
MYLLHCAATGQFAQALTEEGGMRSIMWAGNRSKFERKKCASLRLSVRFDKFEYRLVCAQVGPDEGAAGPFYADPEIKSEDVYVYNGEQKSTLLKRRRQHIEARDADGKVIEYALNVLHNESVLTALRDPYKFRQLFALREEFLNWRFYHNFRTDADSMIRRKQIGALTPVLSHDGRDVAAAIETIQTAGDFDALQKSLIEAFPDSRVFVDRDENSRRIICMQSEGLNRAFDASELSDGTLQYLCLVAALLSGRAPSLLALNEPEGSLHPRLFEPLARLIVRASKQSQIWLTTHSTELADFILEFSGYEPLELKNVEGETKLSGVGLGGYKEYGDDEPEADDDSEFNDK